MGNRVSHNNNDSDANSLFIPKKGRCPKPWCICHDIQCVHEFAVNRRFILKKWLTRWWSDGTYESNYGIYGNEFIGKCDEPRTMDIRTKNTSPDTGIASRTDQELDIPDHTLNIPQNVTEMPYIVPAQTYRKRNKKLSTTN